jgi:hypothetical protein
MTVKELREFLLQFPDDMPVLTSRMSDYDVVEPDQFSVIEAVVKPEVGYAMRSHPTMSRGEKAREQQCLYLWGN